MVIIDHDIINRATSCSISLLSSISLEEHIHHIILSSRKMEWHLFYRKLYKLGSDIHDWICTISEVWADKLSIETTINRIFLGHITQLRIYLPKSTFFPLVPSILKLSSFNIFFVLSATDSIQTFVSTISSWSTFRT